MGHHGGWGGFLSGFFAGELFSWPLFGSGDTNKDKVDDARWRGLKDGNIDAQTIDQYRSNHGGHGFIKGVFWTMIGMASAALCAFAFPILAPIGGALIVGGAVAGAFLSMFKHDSKIHTGYNAYLDQVVAEHKTGTSNAPRGYNEPCVSADGPGAIPGPVRGQNRGQVRG